MSDKKDFDKFNEKVKEINEQSDCLIAIVQKGNKTIITVKGDVFDISNLYRKAFEKDDDFFQITDASVFAWKSLDDFRKKEPSEQLESIADELKKLKDLLN